MTCPCGSALAYEVCCEPYIKGQALPETAEQLMRSRYTAYSKVEIEYLRKTLAPEAQRDFNMLEVRKWAKESEWMGLKIISTKQGTAQDRKGSVEFVASYRLKGEVLDHHETSRFRKTESGQWLFVDGEADTENQEDSSSRPKPEPTVRGLPKLGRNDPCSCGSGKKYKACCLNT